MHRSVLCLAAALAAAPLAAFAQEETPAAAPAEPATAPATTQPATLSAEPVNGVSLAIYKHWTRQADPKLMRADAPEDEVPKVEVKGRDEWAEHYGLKFAFNKLSYRARF